MSDMMPGHDINDLKEIMRLKTERNRCVEIIVDQDGVIAALIAALEDAAAAMTDCVNSSDGDFSWLKRSAEEARAAIAAAKEEK
jgi:hypothetical protein